MRLELKKLGLLLLLMGLVFSLVGCKDLRSNDKEENTKESMETEKIKEEEEKILSPLSGLEVSEDSLNKRPFAVMLDNHFDAIPQSALNMADLIYEFKAEGEFTRYMAIFQSNSPEVIGPVRSARPYFVDTAKEYNAIYAHWGGSELGYAEIPKIGVNDLDGIALEGITYYRNKEVGKKRPHDGYTSSKLLREQAEKYKYDLTDDVKPLKFDTTKDLENIKEQMAEKICTSLTLNFFKSYKEVYEYDESLNKYRVIRNNETVIDEHDKKDVTPSNIIIEFAASKVTGPLGTLTIDIVGSGNGLLLSNGKLIEINWQKNSLDEKTIFTRQDGEEIYLTPGQTWISVADPTDAYEILPAEENVENSAAAENSANADK